MYMCVGPCCQLLSGVDRSVVLPPQPFRMLCCLACFRQHIRQHVAVVGCLLRMGV